MTTIPHPPNPIPCVFYEQSAVEVAPKLLGQTFCRQLPNGDILSGIIVETEAYEPGDPSCHGYRKRTPRNNSMWGAPGTLYVYLTYGMHHCLNIATIADGVASAVLIRALAVEGQGHTLANGPAKLCRALDINRQHDGIILNGNSDIWLEYGDNFPATKITKTTRIGIRKGQELQWRWYMTGHPAVSKK